MVWMPGTVRFDPNLLKKSLRAAGFSELQLKEVVALLAKSDYRLRATELVAILEKQGMSMSSVVHLLTEIGLSKTDAVNTISGVRMRKYGADVQSIVHLEIADE